MIIRCEIFEIGNFVCSFLLRPQVKINLRFGKSILNFFQYA